MRRSVQLVRRFIRRVRTEALVVIGVLTCTAVLLHGAPARHTAPSEHGRVYLRVPSTHHGDVLPRAAPLSRHPFDEAELGGRVGGQNPRQCETSTCE